MDKDPLGTRLKGNYEDRSRFYLYRRIPVIGRIDGKAFHSLTRGMNKPFDDKFIKCMWETAKFLCGEIQGCKLAYIQSDEISLLVTDYDKLETEAWFNYDLRKMCSVGASMATAAFNKQFQIEFDDSNSPLKYGISNKIAMFDARFFNIPKEEVTNYFLWRQRDCERNSIQLLAQANFPHKSLQNLNCSQLQDKLMNEKNINWNDLETFKKRGACVIKSTYPLAGLLNWNMDEHIPAFGSDRNYIEKFI